MKLNKPENSIMIKAVIDTNIFISSLIGNGNPAHIIDSLINKEFDLIISYALLDELFDVLSRPRFEKYFSYDDIKELASLIRSYTQIVSPATKLQICRDPKDDIVIECAVAGEADYIITGDEDLLCLTVYRNIHIITAAQFIRVLKDNRMVSPKC